MASFVYLILGVIMLCLVLFLISALVVTYMEGIRLYPLEWLGYIALAIVLVGAAVTLTYIGVVCFVQ